MPGSEPDESTPPVVLEAADVWNVRLEEYAVRQTIVDGETVGFKDTMRAGSRSEALLQDETAALRIEGRAPQGETTSIPAARILLAHLNAIGGRWVNPEAPEGLERGVDVVACDARDSTQLQMQVTRAVRSPEVWRTLNTKGEAMITGTVAAFVDEVRQAIVAKAIKSSNDCLLVLDATAIGVVALSELHRVILRELGAIADASGYQAVWLVGSLPDLCLRISNEVQPR